ncbi:MAG: HEAT repeat domain-containing protein [Planctomycetaceae bacterium]|nr:HEAT repeat domain-containing protein [Planctomycetaceae bacterium]MCL2304211.1 HEAT repeat domain-containing protein [Planctomycetaceae bacterium]
MMQTNGLTRKILWFLLSFSVLLPMVVGCATDNETLLKSKSCLFTRRSDKIPGLVSPRERAAIIREKATKVREASLVDRNVVVAQLVHEYRISTDPNIRWEVVKALAMIPHPDRIDNLKLTLSDENVNVRIAACRGLAKNIQVNQGLPREMEHTFRHLILNDTDKDVRIAAIQCLTKAGRRCEPETLAVLEQCLNDKTAAVRYAATGTLATCTGKDFGPNVERWLQYFQNQRGEAVPAPKERSLAEKMPKPEWTMFR